MLQSFFQKIDQSERTVHTVCICLLVVAGTAYSCLINSGIAKGYQIHTLESEVRQMSLANQQLEQKVMVGQRVTDMQRRMHMLGFEKAETPVYVTVGTPAYAIAK